MDYQAEIEKVLENNKMPTEERLIRARLLAELGILEEIKTLNKILEGFAIANGGTLSTFNTQFKG